MAGLMDTNKSAPRLQDIASLILGGLLFISPWALHYTGSETAAGASWIGGIVVVVLAIAAIVKFAEWEEWLNMLVGLAVIAAPYYMGFSSVMHAVAAHYVLGILLVLSTGSELWMVHHPTPRTM